MNKRVSKLLSLSYVTDEDIESQVIWVMCPSATTSEKISRELTLGSLSP